MSKTFSLEIGGCFFETELPHDGKIPKPLVPFRKKRPPRAPNCILRATLETPPPQGRCFYQNGRTLRCSRSGKGILIRLTLPPPFDTSLRAIRLNRNASKATLYFKKDGEFFPALMWPALWIALHILLTQKKGILVHASSVISQGKGFLFVGPSGAGKSTIAHLFETSRGGVVLNDDRTIIRKKGRTFWLFGTPWPSSHPRVSPMAAPLTAILFLSHGRRNRLAPLSPKAAIQTCCPELFLPPWHPDGRPAALALLLELCSRVPSYRFCFTPSQKAVAFVRNFLGEHDGRHTKNGIF